MYCFIITIFQILNVYIYPLQWIYVILPIYVILDIQHCVGTETFIDCNEIDKFSEYLSWLHERLAYIKIYLLWYFHKCIEFMCSYEYWIFNSFCLFSRTLHKSKSPLDIGETFYGLRDAVANCELYILRVLRFKVAFDHPHKVWC